MKDTLIRVGARVALAEPLIRLLARGRPAGLDPQIAGMLRLYRLLKFPAIDSMSVTHARRFSEGDLSPLELAPAQMAEVTDTTVAGVPARIYEPRGASGNWIVFFHGGGGAIGSIRGADSTTRYLAAQTHCTVASIDYRLGPEHKHPAAITDACASFAAIADRAQRAHAKAKLAVAGDSFGGYLAAQVEHDARKRNVRRPDVQVLIYPIVDMTLTSPSIDRLAEGFVLTRSLMQWFRGNYMRDTDDFRAASPFYWTDLAGASPAIVSTAGFDPLVDEGCAWADRLRSANVVVRHRHEPGLIHGFLNVAGGIRAARAATDLLCADILDLLK